IVDSPVEVVYREIFYNATPGQEIDASVIGWKSFAGTAGTELTGDGSLFLVADSVGSGSSEAVNVSYQVGSNPQNSFIRSSPTSGERVRLFVMTEDVNIDMTGRYLSEISWFQSHSNDIELTATTRP